MHPYGMRVAASDPPPGVNARATVKRPSGTVDYLSKP